MYTPDSSGATNLAQPRFFRDVTGKALTYLNGINLGRRIWNLDQAIWILQDRHRNRVVFADYLYTQPGAIRDGQWDYEENSGNHFDRYKFEDFKNRRYRFQGWDPATGWPTLESIGLKAAADELEKQRRLGA